MLNLRRTARSSAAEPVIRSAIRAKSPWHSRKSWRNADRSSSRRKSSTFATLGRGSVSTSARRGVGLLLARLGKQVEQQPVLDREDDASRPVERRGGAPVESRREEIREDHSELPQVAGPRVFRDGGPALARQGKDDRGPAPRELLVPAGELESVLAVGLGRAGGANLRQDLGAVARVGEERRRVVVREVLEVFPALGERRQDEGERGIETHEEVRAERALRGLPAQVDVRRGDDAGRVRDGRRRSDAPDDAVVERRQERFLCVQREVLDLVDEERPAGGRLEDARPVGDRARVRAPDRAEERGLEEGFGHGRAVERDERAPAARERVQNLAHEKVLARARRARDEERQRRGCERGDAPPQLAHRRPAPPEEAARRERRVALGEDAPHDAHEPLARRLVLAHRVRERVRPQAPRLVLERDVLVGRREDDGQVRRAAPQPFEDVEALPVAPFAALAPARSRLAERPAVREELLVGDLEAQVEDDGVR